MASTKCVSISPPSHGKGVHMCFRSNPPPPLVPNPHPPWHPGPPLGTQAPPPLVPTCLLDESLNSPRTGAWYQWGWSLGTKAGGVSRGWCRSQFTETRNGHRFVFTISEAISICFFTTSCRNTNVNLIAKCFIAEAHANTNKMMTYTKNSKTLNEFHYDFYSPLPDGHQLMLTTKYKQLDDTNHKQPKISRWNKKYQTLRPKHRPWRTDHRLNPTWRKISCNTSLYILVSHYNHNLKFIKQLRLNMKGLQHIRK